MPVPKPPIPKKKPEPDKKPQVFFCDGFWWWWDAARHGWYVGCAPEIGRPSWAI
jgi:hypothetical protein